MCRKFRYLLINSSLTVLLCVSSSFAGIVADHNAVAQFDSIPQQYIDSVKRMLLYIVGESHSTSYGIGIQALAAQNPKYPGIGALHSDVQYAGTANPSYPTVDPLNPKLRMIRGYGGENFWFANLSGVGGETRSIERMLDVLRMYNSQGVSAIGFGWCWDMYWAPYDTSISTTIDPVYRCHWYGRSSYGPNGDKAWGLDSEDSVTTRNTVNIDTYLKATQTYIDSCTARGYHIKPYFSTGPVDPNDYMGRDTNEQAYQRELKHNRIRDYVSARTSVYLFDFADILCYNNAGQLATGSWTDDLGTVHTFHNIHPDYMVSRTYDYHFGSSGALRIAKATWWMLARMAGWSGVNGATTIRNVAPQKSRLAIPSQTQESFSQSFNTMGRVVETKKEKHVTAAGYTISKQNSTNKPSSSIRFK